MTRRSIKTIKDVNAKFVYLEINSLDFQKVRLFLSMTEVLKILEDIRIYKQLVIDKPGYHRLFAPSQRYRAKSQAFHRF